MEKLKNFIWNRSPQDAYRNPYEYKAQEQFVREAFKVLDAIKIQFEKFNRIFTRDDVSLEKAIWMLQLDATDSLIGCLELLVTKKHKVAGRLIRDTVEVLDLSAYFSIENEKSKNSLKKWYRNEVIPNREYRDFVKTNISLEKAEELKLVYSQLSKFNHRTYKSLAYGYILGKDNKLVYDGFSNSNSLIYPGVISMYYSLLANMIQLLAYEAIERKLLKKEVVENIWEESIEEEPINRKYITPEEVFKNFISKKTSNDKVKNSY